MKEAIINTLISTCLVETFIFIMSFKQFESNLHYPPNERTFFLCITRGKKPLYLSCLSNNSRVIFITLLTKERFSFV